MGARVEPFLTAGLGDSSHLLASGDEAVVIDPQRDAERFLAAANANGWRIRAVLETHVHNDYVSGAHEIRAATGAELCMPAGGGYAFEHRRMDEGDEVRVGDVALTAMATPGHTPEHLAWLVCGAAGGEPEAVFTGGSLMVGSAGRTDLLGADRARELTEAQFGSLARLASLPTGVRVLPTHGAGSFCGSAGGETRRSSTIGAEREANPALRHSDVAAFVADRLSGLLEYPAYYRFMAPLNRSGPRLLRDLAQPAPLDPAAVRRAVRDGIPLVDGRDRGAFADAHIPGSLNVELDDRFGTYLGWLIPWNEPVVFVLPEPEGESLREALVQAHRIGFDRVAGYAAGGVDAWSNAGGELASYPTATVDDLREAVRAGADGPALLDVRQPDEWAAGILPGSRTIFVGDLPSRLQEVPAGVRTWVVCQSGHRASMAASLLDRAGRDVRLVTPGGVPDLVPDRTG